MRPDPVGSAAALRLANAELAFQLDRAWLEHELEDATFEAVLLSEAQHLELIVELPSGYELSVRAATHTPDGYDMWTVDVTDEAVARAMAFRQPRIPTHACALECVVELNRTVAPRQFPIFTKVLRARTIEDVVDRAVDQIRERCGLRLAPFGRQAA